jgi:uncharacterized Rmd1/YagE family protein
MSVDDHGDLRLSLAAAEDGSFVARALLLAERIDTRRLEGQRMLGTAPLIARVDEGGVAVLFRYGAVVLYGTSPAAQEALLVRLKPYLIEPFDSVEREEVRLVLRPDADEQVGSDGTISFKALTVERLQLVAEVVARSLVLAYYESHIAAAFDRIEPLAEMLTRSGRPGGAGRILLRQIGDVLRVQHRMVGRVGAGEAPDLLWDHPELDRIYARLVEEYELLDRERVLDRKLDVISRTVETLVDLGQHSSTIRLEWYVIVLIVAEIVISILTWLIK